MGTKVTIDGAAGRVQFGSLCCGDFFQWCRALYRVTDAHQVGTVDRNAIFQPTGCSTFFGDDQEVAYIPHVHINTTPIDTGEA